MLSNYVSLYIPGTRDINTPLAAKEKRELIREYAGRLSREFGGCTAIPSMGFYVSSDGKLIEEKITILKSFTDNPKADDIAKEYAKELKKRLSQESVTVESNSGIDFI